MSLWSGRSNESYIIMLGANIEGMGGRRHFSNEWIPVMIKKQHKGYTFKKGHSSLLQLWCPQLIRWQGALPWIFLLTMTLRWLDLWLHLWMLPVDLSLRSSARVGQTLIRGGVDIYIQRITLVDPSEVDWNGIYASTNFFGLLNEKRSMGISMEAVSVE